MLAIFTSHENESGKHGLVPHHCVSLFSYPRRNLGSQILHLPGTSAPEPSMPFLKGTTKKIVSISNLFTFPEGYDILRMPSLSYVTR